MKTIGTDINIETCIAEGYTMVKFDARKKFNVNTEYQILEYYPEYCEGIAGQIRTDIYYSFNELLELYNNHKKGVNSFAETDKYVNFKDPCIYDFLNLASDLSSYMGLY